MQFYSDAEERLERDDPSAGDEGFALLSMAPCSSRICTMVS